MFNAFSNQILKFSNYKMYDFYIDCNVKVLSKLRCKLFVKWIAWNCILYYEYMKWIMSAIHDNENECEEQVLLYQLSNRLGSTLIKVKIGTNSRWN